MLNRIVIDDVANELKKIAKDLGNAHVYPSVQDAGKDLYRLAGDLDEVLARTRNQPKYNLGPSEVYIKKLEAELFREKFREMWNESVKEYNDAQAATSACQECK